MADSSILRDLADSLDSYSAAAVEEHCRQIDACLDEDLYGSAVVALNAGFESILRESLISELVDHHDYLAERRIEDIEAGEARYSSIIEEASARDIIDDDINDVLDGIRQERNRYVHPDSRAGSRADVDENNDLEEAHDLYQEILEETGNHDGTGRMQRQPGCGKRWPLRRVQGPDRVPA